MPSIHFKGKNLVQNYHLTIPYHQLEPIPELSQTDRPSLHDNVIIHGDNLLALKSLLPSYANRIKCIYIDPPYNTGNENWAYNDAVNSEMHREWLKKTVDREDLTRHDKWLCMMLPRLQLLKELLRDDGVIFISIDDNEVHHLRMLMDEVFGEDNFVATIVWQKKYATANDNLGISPMHDFLLVYQKSPDWNRNLLARTQENDKQYRFEDEQGVFRPDNYTCNKSADERPNLYYPIVQPNTGEEIWPKRTAVWRYSQERHKENVRSGLVYWGKDGDAHVPSFKRYKHLLKGGGGIVPATWWPHEVAGHTDEARKEVRELFFDDNTNLLDFVTPKPTRLIQRILQIASDPDSIILDSFAGSGTTGHAVLAQNAEDGGNRRFILIEQEDYANTITAERIRRVMNGVPNAKDDLLQNGYGGTFSYFNLGPTVDEAAMLTGDHLPSYLEMARYVYFNATGDQLDETVMNSVTGYLGSSNVYEVYLIYQPDIEFLKNSPLTYDWAKRLGMPQGKKRLVCAAHKYLDGELLRELQIEFCQLPFAITRFRG